MQKPSSPDANIRANERGNRRERLERLSGFNLLTRRQRDLILGLSYMQDLADRGRRAGGFVRAGKLQESWWCHKTIHNLELEQSIDVNLSDEKNRPPQEFYDVQAAYEKGSIESQMRRVKDFGYPCVLLLRDTWKSPTGASNISEGALDNSKTRQAVQSTAIHTLLALGEDEYGDIWAFQKDGAGPFEEARVREALSEYDIKCFDRGRELWMGIRKVRCPVSDEHRVGVIEPKRVKD